MGARKENAISVLSGLLEKRDECQRELDALVANLRVKDDESGEERDRELTPEEEQRSNELLETRASLDARIKEESERVATQNMLAEARRHAGVAEYRSDGTADAQVTDEPKVYGPDSPNSWYADTAIIATRPQFHPRYRDAVERMLRWSDQVEHEVARRSKFGQYAKRALREVFRSADGVETKRVLDEVETRGRVAREHKDGVEQRVGVGTGGGATASAAGGGAAAFVTPVFVGPYVPYREYGRAFADQCAKPPLPDYGMAIYKPILTGPAGVAQFAEVPPGGSGVTEVDPGTAYTAGTLVIFAGQITLSQAVLDRTSPDFKYDLACEDQLQRDYAPKFDAYVLAQALANATSQTYSGTFKLSTVSGSGGFYGQVSQAKSGMRKAVGTVLNPTSLFLDPARWEYIAAWADANGRALVVPDYAGPFNAAANSGDGDAGIEGYTGARFNGLRVFTDANIPTTGGTANLDQGLVSDLSEVEVYEGQPYDRVLPQTLASNLETIMQRYSYATVIVNYPKAVTSINGSAMSAPVYS